MKNRRETYLLAAADLGLFLEGSEEYCRAEAAAMNTSKTVFELFGATAAEDLWAADLKKRRQVAERIRRGHAETNFEKVTAGPESLAAFLFYLPLLAGPQDGVPDHVGIVENGRVYTVEGNSGDKCCQRSYPGGIL